MNIPPFPAQDLAKLVLGYLAEEQLMTAYDEFLQASPYLDAFGNEYDRIFMTSLKNILAEYRAVKIYVETCKPFHLRRKLFQFTSLLEMVKFLIQNVDISQILTQEQNQTKCSVEKQNANEKVDCEVCRSLKLETCSCNVKSCNADGQSKDNYEESVLDSSVEATSLSDLPGNHVTERKKIVCVSDSTTSDLNAINSVRLPNSSISLGKKDITNNMSTSVHHTATQSSASQNNIYSGKHPDPGIPIQTRQNEEFNHILNHVCHQNQRVTMHDNKQILMGSYKNFATGVNGGSSGTIIVPDTSTSEKVYYQIPVSGESFVHNNKFVGTKVKQTRTQYLLKVAHVTNSTKPNEIVTITTTNNRILPKATPEVTSIPTPKPTPNPDENKVKILSDVKVDNSISSDGSLKMPPVLKNATSTPILQMQTVVINGTPVYQQKPDQFNYTKDEIMAMPTIILAPAQGPPAQSVCSITQDPQPINNSSKPRSLGPLTIDVCTEHLDEDKPADQVTEELNANNDKVIPDGNIPKTFDVTSASAPKDITVTGTSETSTPQGLPPIRKSSSTPRRTSHVRVLDFATPRRILHESMNKCITIPEDVEVVSKTTEIVNPDTDLQNNEKDNVCDSTKENAMTNNTVLGKKGNWDADLRALAVAAQVSKPVNISNPASKPRSRTRKKKKDAKNPVTTNEDEKQNKEKSSKKRTPKPKSAKKYIPEPPEEVDLFKDNVNIPVKPTINIISGGDRGAEPVPTVAESDKSQNKSNEENINDTPEIERMSLQNEIGAKLNISDLLETPYKQALYDIQMETPRFLGPDLPDDPMSDIKIMNIPTPKFLSIPTPSSYSSRPTDYSSGGSYYKPDDQDYMRITDDLICPVTSSVSKESIKSDTSNNKETESSDNNEKSNDKPTRPVRQCTKNVSYYNSSNLKKDVVDSDITDSSFCESTIERETKITYSSKENKSKICNKSDIKVSTKKRRSPKKEASKSFMKIKPRRPTPSKKDIGKRKRNTPESSKALGRKRVTKQDERKSGATPAISAVPTKSRRKSSTPRKLHCTKSFNSESSGHDSPEMLAKAKESTCESNIVPTHDSDTEQLPLRWSDDGSQDTKSKEVETNVVNESEDISKIQEYLKTAAKDDDLSKEGRLHIDLVKRGFDLETAKIIERELLDASPHTTQDFAVTSDIIITAATSQVTESATETKSNVPVLEKTIESDRSTSNNLQIVQDDNEEEEEEIEEVEMTVHECNADTDNFFSLCHDDTKDTPIKELPKLKDKFSMEVCLDDDLSIRLRATQFNSLFDQEPDDSLLNYDEKETEMAVRSISNMDKLYTPLKQSVKDQCYEIFDSTLTSLDTPLKPTSPKFREEVTVTEIVLEVESLEVRERDTKKRKRAQSGNVSDENESKKAKPEAQYLLNSANIQNIDIESVLSKLHGP